MIYPKVPLIKTEKNYEKFSLINWNRDVNKGNVRKLVEENNKEFKMHLFPILIDNKFKIIDGQHRYMACLELDCPIYYIETGAAQDYYEEIRSVNSAGRRHTLADMYNMLLKKGDDEAVRVMEICNSFDKTFSVTAVLRVLAIDGGQLNASLAKGKLALSDLVIGYNILENLYYSSIIGKEKSEFPIAIKNICKRNDIDPADFIAKVENSGFVVRKGMTRAIMQENLVAIWNKGRKKSRIESFRL